MFHYPRFAGHCIKYITDSPKQTRLLKKKKNARRCRVYSFSQILPKIYFCSRRCMWLSACLMQCLISSLFKMTIIYAKPCLSLNGLFNASLPSTNKKIHFRTTESICFRHILTVFSLTALAHD